MSEDLLPERRPPKRGGSRAMDTRPNIGLHIQNKYSVVPRGAHRIKLDELVGESQAASILNMSRDYIAPFHTVARSFGNLSRSPTPSKLLVADLLEKLIDSHVADHAPGFLFDYVYAYGCRCSTLNEALNSLKAISKQIGTSANYARFPVLTVEMGADVLEMSPKTFFRTYLGDATDQSRLGYNPSVHTIRRKKLIQTIEDSRTLPLDDAVRALDRLKPAPVVYATPLRPEVSELSNTNP